MNCASTKMSASRRRRIASLLFSTLVSLLNWSSFICAAASVPSEM
jgi:hypothetical protein